MLPLHLRLLVGYSGDPLIVVWTLDPKQNRHGEIDNASKTILIYDADEQEAGGFASAEFFGLPICFTVTN